MLCGICELLPVNTPFKSAVSAKGRWLVSVIFGFFLGLVAHHTKLPEKMRPSTIFPSNR